MDCDILQASAGIRLGNIKSMPCNANWLPTLIISLGSALALNAVRLTDSNIQQQRKRGRGEEEDCHIHSGSVFKETCLTNEKSWVHGYITARRQYERTDILFQLMNKALWCSIDIVGQLWQQRVMLVMAFSFLVKPCVWPYLPFYSFRPSNTHICLSLSWFVYFCRTKLSLKKPNKVHAINFVKGQKTLVK